MHAWSLADGAGQKRRPRNKIKGDGEEFHWDDEGDFNAFSFLLGQPLLFWKYSQAKPLGTSTRPGACGLVKGQENV